MRSYICPYWKRTNPVYDLCEEFSYEMDDDLQEEPVRGVRQKKFTKEEALDIGKTIGIDFSKINLEQFRKGLEVELEHGTRFPQANVTGDDPILTGKIAYAHLLEIPDYYTRLAAFEKEAKAYWGIEG